MSYSPCEKCGADTTRYPCEACGHSGPKPSQAEHHHKLVAPAKERLQCTCGTRQSPSHNEGCPFYVARPKTFGDLQKLEGLPWPKEQLEAVDHPAHYGGADNPYEAIKVIQAWGLGFCLGNAVKYISRAGKKDPNKEVEDLKKARWYLDQAIREMETKK